MRFLQRFGWMLVLPALLIGGASSASAASQITEYPIPTASSGPESITTGPDGALWFTQGNANKIGRITPAGVFSEYNVPTANSFPSGITAGPDGALWFTEEIANNIGRITTGGAITEFAGLPPSVTIISSGITSGPDGALWFTEGGFIGRITTGGVVSQFPLTQPVPPGVGAFITAGPDGALWFTVNAFGTNGAIGRITTAGGYTLFPISASSFPHSPMGITTGPDGQLWFTDFGFDSIARMNTAGAFTELATPTAGSRPSGISAGLDGALWFVETDGNKIGRITTGGAISEFAIPTAGSQPRSITLGPDGNLWFTESGANKIGKLAPAHHSLALDGSAGYADVQSVANLNPAADWSAEAWFKDQDPAGFNHEFRQIINKGDRNVDPEAPYFITIGNNHLLAGVRTSGVDYPIDANLAYLGLDPSKWHHVAVTYRADLQVLNLWLDGTHISYLAGVPASKDNTLPLELGRNGPQTGKYWLGKLDDVRLWNVALTDAQVKADYQTEFSGNPPANLVANWQFDEASGTIASEFVSTNAATLHGGASFSTDVHP